MPLLSCRFIPLLGELLDCPHTGLRCAATDVLIEIVSKRMEPTAKISLVQQLKVVEACERLSTNLVMAAGASKAAAAAAGSRAGQGGGGDGSSGSDGSAAAAAAAAAGQQLAQDEELLAKYAKLLATLAGEVMDALKRIENGECWSACSAPSCSRLCECPWLGAALPLLLVACNKLSGFVLLCMCAHGAACLSAQSAWHLRHSTCVCCPSLCLLYPHVQS
jgi:hypothetical protein